MPIKVLANLHLPIVEGYKLRTFGDYPEESKKLQPWRAEFERRSLVNILPLIPKDEKPDILLISSPEYLPIPVDIGSFSGIKILLITDWNVCLKFLPNLMPLFDFCFTDWPGFQLFKKSGIKNIYHGPLFGHDPEAFKNQGLNRDIDISFCGNLNGSLHSERNRLLARMVKWNKTQQKSTIHLHGVFGEEYQNILNRSQMVFNYSIRGEANMRLFESMATGSVPLIESSNQEAGIFFQEGKHYLKYKIETFENCLDDFINEPKKISSIALAAQDAVKNHTKSKQLQRILNSCCEMAAGRKILSPMSFGSSGEKINPDFAASTKSLMKLRILGLGYTLSDALVEIQATSQNQELYQETISAILINLLENNPNRNLNAAENMLFLVLKSKFLPDIVLNFSQMYFYRMKKDWERVLTFTNKGLSSISGSSSSSSLPQSLYQYFYPPIFLGDGLTSDLNRAFQKDLFQIGFIQNNISIKNSSEKKGLELTQLLLAHFTFAKAQALEKLGSWEESLEILNDLISHSNPSIHSFASLKPYSLLLKLLVKKLQSENFGIDQIQKTIETWFAYSPLDTEAWTEMYHALMQVTECTGDKTLCKNFLEETLILAKAFYSETQVNAIKTMLNGLKG